MNEPCRSGPVAGFAMHRSCIGMGLDHGDRARDQG